MQTKVKSNVYNMQVGKSDNGDGIKKELHLWKECRRHYKMRA